MARPRINRDAPDEMWDRFFDQDVAVAEQALEDLVIHYQYLVEAISRKLEYNLPSYIADEDLIALGQLGLMRALHKYNPEVGRFSKYASTVIWGAIIDGLRADDFAPRGLRKRQREVDKAIKELHHLGNFFPSDEDVADHLDIPLDEVRDINHRVTRSNISPTDPVYMPDGQVADDYETPEMCSKFVDWLRDFPRETQEVIAYKYWYGLTHSDISRTMQIPAERVKDCHRSVIVELLPFMRELVSTT